MRLLSGSWFSDVPWLHVYVGFSLTIEAFEQYLSLRQWRRYSNSSKPPTVLNPRMSQESYASVTAYNTDKIKLSMVSSLVESGLSVLSTLFFFGPFCWRLAGHWAGDGEFVRPLAFMGIQRLVSECISTPFQVYSDFCVEEKHGFNKKTAILFIKDKLLGLGLTAAIGAPILCAVNWLIKWGGENFHFWLWGFSVLTTFGMIVIYPNFIAPLFNKFKVLGDRELRSKIDALAEQLNFPLCEVYEMDGSKRSSHSNAYFYGFWRWKRIVIFDTLLHLPHDQILAILGHELGHWQMNHFMQRLLLVFMNLFVTFYLYGKVMNNDHLYKCFGYGADAKSPIIGLMLLANVLAPVNTVLSVFSTLLSRKHEFQADAFACQLHYGEQLKEALCTVHTENKSTLDPDPWYSWWHYSHPPLLERLAAIDSILLRDGKKERSRGGENNSSRLQELDGEDSRARGSSQHSELATRRAKLSAEDE
ncbi:peptidase family M48 domain-containing protein, putative [Eimeria tenella]|uniref:CAAX prenyl protease n=2 Tax=Eimeria tenella TaxID=5802 RepID=U6KXJ1_EIMTE|nr:peptidase family M48 domain-containing protein, putative [Eimeria tenella]CDJ42877.1 peptidase family M48 domain-containing protein, putative [Eimeria tenella]|eukprot:XP_013233627.1 peptidase family M48 domain-containing protein, putative [Eimeria tenella]